MKTRREQIGTEKSSELDRDGILAACERFKYPKAHNLGILWAVQSM
jgi:hypothetical protein